MADFDEDAFSLERADSIANRDDAIPILKIPSRGEAPEPSSSSEVDSAQQKTGGKKDKLKDGVG